MHANRFVHTIVLAVERPEESAKATTPIPTCNASTTSDRWLDSHHDGTRNWEQVTFETDYYQALSRSDINILSLSIAG